MLQVSAEMLALSSEAALLIRGGKILYANDAARNLLGADCASKRLRDLLGAEVAGMQAPTFVGEIEAGGKRLLLRQRTMEGLRIVFLNPNSPAGELVGDASLHAMRSELMQLGVSAAVLRKKITPGDAEAAAALNGVTQSLYRANRTLQNYSIIRSAKMSSLYLRPQPLDLCELVRNLVEAVRLMVPEPEILLTLPESLPIRGMPSLLEVMVLNLLSNALRHAEGCTAVRVMLRNSGEQVILSVNDDGCGIPADRLHTVLERYLYSNDLYAAGHGAGFGLSVVREIARAHGGTLLLESREGAGTAVRVSLSLAPHVQTTLHAPAEQEHGYDAILTGLAPCLPPEAFTQLE